MSKRTHRIVFTVLVLVLIDQATKTLAHANRFEHTSVLPIGNPETALGLIQGSRQTLIVLTALGMIAFGVYLPRRVASGLPHWVAGLLIAGAGSNLIDRVVVGHVRDFIALPGVIVNAADVFLVIGTVALLIFDGRLRRSTGSARTSRNRAGSQARCKLTAAQ